MELGGLPLIEWTLTAALNSKFISKIVVSTDDPLILEIATKFGIATIVRPLSLSTDESTSADVITHVTSKYSSFDFLIYLQPTSPFRTSEHIDFALQKAFANPQNGVVSVRESFESPELMYFEGVEGSLIKLIPNTKQNRQEFSKYYVLNGAIYIASKSLLVSSCYNFSSMPLIPVMMDDVCSLDIDDISDFTKAQERVAAGLQPH